MLNQLCSNMKVFTAGRLSLRFTFVTSRFPLVQAFITTTGMHLINFLFQVTNCLYMFNYASKLCGTELVPASAAIVDNFSPGQLSTSQQSHAPWWKNGSHQHSEPCLTIPKWLLLAMYTWFKGVLSSEWIPLWEYEVDYDILHHWNKPKGGLVILWHPSQGHPY